MYFKVVLLLTVSSLMISVPVFAANDAATVELSKTSGLIFADSIPGGEIDYSVTVSPEGIRTLILDWDGSDSAPDVFDAGGLGGLDFSRLVQIDTPATDALIAHGSVAVFDDQGHPMNPVIWNNVGAVRITRTLTDPAVNPGNVARDAAGWFTVIHRMAASGRDLITADLILQEGDTPPGGGGNIIMGLNNPFTDGNGTVGFTGMIDNSGSDDHFVFYDDQVVHRNSQIAPEVLNGAEATMGIGNLGEFIFSPSVDTWDAVWTSSGLLLKKSDQAPGFATGTLVTFNSRPTMLPDATAVWIAGFDDTGGTSTKGRMIYRSADLNPANIEIVIKSDDLVGGIPIDRPSGVGFDYQVSDNNTHHIQELILDTGSSIDDGIVYVDGAIAARESQPAPANGNWDNFDRMVINDSGNYCFSGDTDGDTATDEFICYNGTLALREGDTIAGIALVSGSTVNVMSLNNDNHLIHQWSVNSVDTLFYTCDPTDFANTSYKILAAGDEVDLDGDGIADATVTDLNASGGVSFGYSLAEDGYVYAEVDLDYGGGEIEAIIRILLPECGPGPCINDGDVNLDDQITAGDAQLAFLITLGSYTPSYEEECAADCNGDETVTAGDAQLIFLTVLGSGNCVDPM